jgi:hypothetical protein
MQSWENLKAYWMTDLQQEKVEKMANAMWQVKNYSSVGRKCRGEREAQLVSVFLLSESLTFYWHSILFIGNAGIVHVI